MATKRTQSASKIIEIDGVKFLPVNFETEYTLQDNNFAIEHVSEHMGMILSLQENLIAIKKLNDGNGTEEINENAISSAYAAMSNIKITPELLSLVYKRQGSDGLNYEERDDNIELFSKMKGTINYNKAKAECLNFISFISKHISDGMLIYSQVTDKIIK